MDNEQIQAIQNKLEEINRNIITSHNYNLNLIQTIINRQVKLGKFLNIEDTPAPFSPYYHPSAQLAPDYPEIYNKYGEKMEVFFIRDREFAHMPNENRSRYIIWDRYNYGLKTHFYTHDEMFHIVGKPERKFGLMIEPYAIKPQSYEHVLQNKDYIENNFDAVFTFDARLLSTLKNAKFYVAAHVLYGQNYSDYLKSDNTQKITIANFEENYKRKTKNISMICSAKEMCEGHIRRKKLAFKVKNEKLADTFGKFDGGGYVPIELPFEDYRFSIAVENSITPFYFTEKIMNCFAAQTVPIYLGATEIGRFFNPEGIIQITVEDCDHIEDILAKCTPEEYERRLPAILDNFNRVKPFMDHIFWDEIYLNYLKK